MPVTVLLLTPETTTHAADALRLALDAEVLQHDNLRAGLQTLRQRDVALIVLDESLASLDAAFTERISEVAISPILEMNLAICSAPRLVRQCRPMLARRSRDLALARTTASRELYSELSQTFSGLLLKSEFALRQASPEVAPHLREVVELAHDLRDRLRS